MTSDMSVPPPLRDPAQLERRLRILAEMLDQAVEEVRRVAADIRSTSQPAVDDHRGDTDA